MSMKMFMKIIFLILLCIPIIYIQYCILKNTAGSVYKERKKKGITNIYLEDTVVEDRSKRIKAVK